MAEQHFDPQPSCSPTRILALAGTLAFFLVTAIVTTGCSSGSAGVPGAGATTRTDARAKAPDFSAASLAGGMLSLTDLKTAGKPIVITFGASW